MPRTLSASAIPVAALAAAVGTAVLMMAGAGCSKDEAAGTPPPAAGMSEAGLEAKEYFVSAAYPKMGPDCGRCHSGTGGGGSTFLGATAEQSYTRLTNQAGYIAEPSQSVLINHLHQDKTITLVPEVRVVITQWLNLEATARGLTGSVQAPPTLSEAYKAFANCMNFNVWDYYRMGDLPFTQTDLDGPCMGCHSTGQAGAYLSASSRATFDQAKQFPYIQKYVVGKVDAAGRFEKLIPANRFIDKANEKCAPGKEDCHPAFGLPPMMQDGIVNFVQTTLQNLATDTCSTFVLPGKDAGADGGNDGS